MEEYGSNPSITCTLTEDQEAERSEQVRSVLASNYRGVEEHDDGYSLLFDDTDESISAVATFVGNELQCCSFASYTIDVSPPYAETRLTIIGPEGTKKIFDERLIDWLEDEIR